MPASTASAGSSCSPRAAEEWRRCRSEREAAGIRRLPQSLGEALDTLEATPEARDWFGPVYLDAYLRHKRGEIKMVAEMTETSSARATR